MRGRVNRGGTVTKIRNVACNRDGKQIYVTSVSSVSSANKYLLVLWV